MTDPVKAFNLEKDLSINLDISGNGMKEPIFDRKKQYPAVPLVMYDNTNPLPVLGVMCITPNEMKLLLSTYTFSQLDNPADLGDCYVVFQNIDDKDSLTVSSYPYAIKMINEDGPTHVGSDTVKNGLVNVGRGELMTADWIHTDNENNLDIVRANMGDQYVAVLRLGEDEIAARHGGNRNGEPVRNYYLKQDDMPIYHRGNDDKGALKYYIKSDFYDASVRANKCSPYLCKYDCDTTIHYMRAGRTEGLPRTSHNKQETLLLNDAERLKHSTSVGDIVFNHGNNDGHSFLFSKSAIRRDGHGAGAAPKIVTTLHILCKKHVDPINTLLAYLQSKPELCPMCCIISNPVSARNVEEAIDNSYGGFSDKLFKLKTKLGYYLCADGEVAEGARVVASKNKDPLVFFINEGQNMLRIMKNGESLAVEMSGNKFWIKTGLVDNYVESSGKTITTSSCGGNIVQLGIDDKFLSLDHAEVLDAQSVGVVPKGIEYNFISEQHSDASMYGGSRSSGKTLNIDWNNVSMI